MNTARMELEVWKGDWGLPSIDLKSLEALAFIQFSGAKVNIIKKSNPFWTPSGAFPVFRHGKQRFTDITSIADYLKNKNFSPDFGLNDKQAAEIIACSSMLREQLHPALQYIWWVDEKNYYGLSRPWYSETLPLPWNFYYPRSYRNKAISYFESLFPLLDSSELIESEVYSAAQKCLTALSIRLGDSDFFFGKHPTSLDAIVYAYLAPLMKAPFLSNVLQNHAKACQNLLTFVKRISNRYFLKDVQAFEERQKKLHEKNKADENQYKMKNNILAAAVVAFLMTYYAMSKGFLTVTEGDGFDSGFQEDSDDDDEYPMDDD